MALTTYEMAARLLTPLHTYRNLVRRERRLRYLGAASLTVGVAWALAAVLFYLDLIPSWLVPLCLVLTVALPASAILAEAMRKPTIRETARLVDARLDDRQRLVTAVELIESEAATLVPRAQVATTTGLLEGADPRAIYPVRAPAQAFALSAGLLLLALGIFMLKGLGSDTVPMAGGGLPGEQALAALMSPTPLSGLPGSDLTPTPETGAPQAQEAPQGADPNVQNQADASQEAQSSLDRLRDALGEQSATQQASDSLRQGNVDDAAKELAELGQQNDQLSDAAKQGLADSLQRAANESWDDPNLQRAEQQAADALRNGSYEDIERALRNLGEAAQDTAQNVVPQEELAQGFPEPPQGGTEQGQPGGESSQSEGGSGSQEGGQQGAQSQGEQGGQQSEGSQSGGQEGAGGGEGGEQGQPSDQQGEGQGSASGGGQDNGEQGQSSGGAGDGHRVSGPRDTTDLGVEGNPFELEGRPDPNNSRPTERNDDPPALTLEGGSGAGGGSSPSTPGDRVTTPGESSRLPVERWGIVQRYFSRER